MKIVEIDETIRKDIIEFIKKNWGSGIMVTRGKVHNMDMLPGFAAIEENEVVGLVTYFMENGECEIVSLDSLRENTGLGTKLLEIAVETVKNQGCKRVWLITTNDNIRAIGFYQKRGFEMKAIYKNAVKEARRIKPEIPLVGDNNIPILHEIEFEKILLDGEEENINDLNISSMMDMSYKLWEKHKDTWAPMEPQVGKSFILYMIEEIGEVIAIIKKKGEEKIMNEPEVRDRFVEEMGDVLMYFIDTLNRFKVSCGEFSKRYVKKYNSNMKRDYDKQYDKYIGNSNGNEENSKNK